MPMGRPPKARPKPLATYEQNRDMYGFMVRPQHLEQYREYATIYKEEEAERSDRWEQFLGTINENVPSAAAPALELSSSEAATHKRADSSDLEDGGETSVQAGRDEEAEKGAAKLWGQLRKSLWAIERAASIRGRGLRTTSSSAEEPVVSRSGNVNGAAPNSFVPVRTKGHEGAQGLVHDGGIVNDGDVAIDVGAEADSGRGEGGGDDSDDEFCDATESTDVLHEGESTSPPKIVPVESPWEEELRSLVRGGVPMALRGELWQVFVGTKTRRARGHYNALLTLLADGGGDGSGAGGLLDGSGSAATNYLVSKTGVLEKWTNQIEKDLPRTFPGHPALDEDGRNTLRRLLTAYARHNPSVGYCQAMNFLAALLLLLMPEENAFWTLTGIIDDYFEGYYSEKMVEAQVDQLVFEDLVREQFPKLVNHLDALGVQVAWVSGPWFLSIFVNVLPWESVLRVWDVLLYEGNRCMLFRTGLALMEIHAPALTVTRDAGDAVALLQSIASATFDSSLLVLTACMGFQTVTEKRLQEFRLKRRPEVLAALQERSIELHLWRNSNSAMTQKLPYLYHTESSADTLLIKKAVVVSEEKMNGLSTPLADTAQADDLSMDCQVGVSTKCPVSFEESSLKMAIENNVSPRPNEGLDGEDIRDQVAWLKSELSQALQDKKAAIRRAEELETALVEMVKQDNRRLLSAQVEKLEAEVGSLSQLLLDKKEQEQALVQVLVRMENEQKIADDARRFAELDSAAQRRAAEVFQEKYEGAADALAEMEKRTVMAETMLEATLSYQALGNNSPVGSGPLRRHLTEPSLARTPESMGGSPLKEPLLVSRSHQNGSNGSDTQDSDERASAQGAFNRPFGLNWRDRSKARIGSLGESPTRTPVRSLSGQGLDTGSTLEDLRRSSLEREQAFSIPLLDKQNGSVEGKNAMRG